MTLLWVASMEDGGCLSDGVGSPAAPLGKRRRD